METGRRGGGDAEVVLFVFLTRRGLSVLHTNGRELLEEKGLMKKGRTE